jgi:hypothetical protein
MGSLHLSNLVFRISSYYSFLRSRVISRTISQDKEYRINVCHTSLSCRFNHFFVRSYTSRTSTKNPTIEKPREKQRGGAFIAPYVIQAGSPACFTTLTNWVAAYRCQDCRRHYHRYDVPTDQWTHHANGAGTGARKQTLPCRIWPCYDRGRVEYALRGSVYKCEWRPANGVLTDQFRGCLCTRDEINNYPV